MTKRLASFILLLLSITAAALHAADTYGEKTFTGLELRPIGPALTSGRIIDLAVDPRDTRVWYVATAGRGVWKTTNAGVRFDPIFDDQGSPSIGCVALDPHDSLIVWVGTG